MPAYNAARTLRQTYDEVIAKTSSTKSSLSMMQAMTRLPDRTDAGSRPG